LRIKRPKSLLRSEESPISLDNLSPLRIPVKSKIPYTMRLLDTASLKLKEFADNEIPAYGILSHTWEKDEVSFQDMQSGHAEEKAGYAKIKGCCEEAKQSNRLKYVWVDTCCIDKTSSSELSEAINSMYRWYENAFTCYTYLADVSSDKDIEGEGSSFAKSRWFTRGWTLQELIAPSRVHFHGKDWQFIGSKESLQKAISSITGVDVKVIRGSKHPQTCSIAARLSWASKRNTTRKEDIAYCLMGLLGVNMPLLYGEGDRAFMRLQEEILKISDDHSLFAWKESNSSRKNEFQGLLATSPAYFVDSCNIVPIPNDHRTTQYSLTNQGLHIELVLLPGFGSDIYLAVLDCTEPKTEHRGPIGIYLKWLSPPNGNQFARVFPNELRCVGRTCGNCTSDILPTRNLYVKQQPLVMQLQDNVIDWAYWFRIQELPSSTGYAIAVVHPPERWDPLDRILKLPSKSIGIAGVLLFKELQGSGRFAVVIAVNCNFCVSVRIEKIDIEIDLKVVYAQKVQDLETDATSRLVPDPKVTGLNNYQGISLSTKRPTHIYRSQDRLRIHKVIASAKVREEEIQGHNMFVVQINLEVC
jgi:hypothetical protein